MFKVFFSLLIPVFLGTSVSLQAEEAPIETTEYHLIHKIIKNQKYCVRYFEEDKIFIGTENIVSTGEGLFLNLNGEELFPLPLLQYSKNGHFVQGSLMQEVLAAKEDTRGPCPECGVNTSKYGHCTNTQCFFYGLRVKG